ncbi:hypothetical protein H4R19_005405, partial [Coemansia spiralis]
MPRLEDLVRSASRLPNGLGIQTLLSRILPQLAGNTASAASGSDRLALPLSSYVRWLSERQLSDASAQGHRGCGHGAAGGAQAPDQLAAELELRLRENMEAFQYMHTRLYEVLQNVQRDNHVGLPAPSLVEHLSGVRSPTSGDVYPAQSGHRHARRASAAAGDGAESNDDDEAGCACDAASTAPAAELSARALESQAGTLMPFLQNILDHMGVLGPAGGAAPGAAPLAANPAASVAGQLLGAKEQPYPFDMAASALFSHSLVVLELSQRGIRNPPVFNHEDSRTLPSGSLADAVPESHAAFMYALAKIAELHYRAVLQPAAELGSPSAGGLEPQTPAQRLHALIAESCLLLAPAATASAPVSGALTASGLARTRLEMLGDMGGALAPLFGPHRTSTREYAQRQARWLTGSDDVAARPLLMQNVFTVFSGLSLSLVAPFKLDIWHLMRLFVTAELVRVCVAVGDSLLGEYTGAPRALRIAQTLPCTTDDPGRGPASPLQPPAAAGARRTAKDVPRPWVDAPEARDVNLLSVLTSGSDAALLETAAPAIHKLVVWAIRQLQGPAADPATLERLHTAAHPITVTKLVATLLLPFLRRVALQLGLQYGLDVAAEAPWLQAERRQALGGGDYGTQVLPQSEPECVRLLKLLNLPGLDQIFDPA